MNYAQLGELFADKVATVDPRANLDEQFELWSMPAYDVGKPEVLFGRDIGSAKKCVQPNDVLLSRIIPHIRRACVVPDQSGRRQIASGEWIVFRSKRFVPAYLRHFLLSDVFHAQFMNTVAGVGGSLLRARPDAVGKIRVPIPSLSEQQRIAAILDLGDDIFRKRQHADQRHGMLKVSLFESMFGDVRTNTNHFRRSPLGELIAVSSGDGLTKDKQNGGPYPVYGGNGINGYHDRFSVPSGTIIIGRVGVYCGAVHVTSKNAWVTDNALIVTTKTDQVTVDYLAAALELANLNQYAGRSAQPLVSGSRIYPVEILVPPLDKQRRFGALVTKLDRMSNARTSARQKLVDLFEVLKAGAFEGLL